MGAETRPADCTNPAGPFQVGCRRGNCFEPRLLPGPPIVFLTRELAAMKASVAQLAEAIHYDRTATLSNSIALATMAANTETIRLLSQYSNGREYQRAEDQRDLAATLKSFDQRIAQLRTELETVAVNTESGFEETHDNITRLASLSLPVRNRNETVTHPE